VISRWRGEKGESKKKTNAIDWSLIEKEKGYTKYVGWNQSVVEGSRENLGINRYGKGKKESFGRVSGAKSAGGVSQSRKEGHWG